MRTVLLVWPITLSGWVLAGLYLFYERIEFGHGLAEHLFSTESISGALFHFFILGAPVISTYLGYTVNERIKLMTDIKDIEARYRDYYENAPIAYHSSSPDQTLLEVNATWLNMLGYERDEVIGRIKFQQLIQPESFQRFTSYYDDFINTGRLSNAETVLMKKDGTPVPVMISATAVKDHNGRFLRTRTIIRDISERKEFEAALTGAATEWKSTFDAMPWGVMLLDRRQTILRANTYVAQMAKMDIKDLIGSNSGKVVFGTAVEDTALEAAFNTGTPSMAEVQDASTGRQFRVFCNPVTKDGQTAVVVQSLVEITDLKEHERKLIDSRNAFFNMLRDISAANKELQELYTGLIYAFANAIDAKSHWTKGHSERVSRFAVSIAQEMKIKKSEVEKLRTAALLHDIGKIGTYDYLLDKPEKLTEEEYEIVKEHPLHSARILEPLTQLGEIIDVIKFHHERFDGRGYPLGLRGLDIPLMARILCVADSFDSMTADRPYRPAPGVEYAINELKSCSGTHFDPDIVIIFLRILEREGHTKERYFSPHGNN